MVNSDSITKIYLSFIGNKINEQEALNKLIMLIQDYPQFFGLQYQSKDNKQDFLYFLISRINKIFENYNPDKAKFSTYFQVTVRYNFESWKKEQFQTNLHNKCFIENDIYDNYTKSIETIYSPEKDFESMVSEQEPLYYPVNKSRLKKEKITELELLVITLKSSYFVSNEHIKKILNNININKVQLMDFINELNEKMITKIAKKNKISAMISKDYIKMQTLKINIDNLDYNCTKQQVLQKKYQLIKKKRAKRIEKLKQIKLVPSDSEISKMLNISTGKIRYILRKNYKLYNIDYIDRKSYKNK